MDDRTTVISLFNERAAGLGDKTALVTLRDGVTQIRTWRDYAKEVRALSRALAAAGVGRGDGVAVLSGNRAEYHIVDVATLACGAVAVPIYHSNSPEQVKYVLDHSDAKVVFCEGPDDLAKVAEIRSEVPKLVKVVTFTTGEADATYADLIAEGTSLDAADPKAYDKMCDDVAPDDLACLIYTSGTTGPPKGAMISHRNVVWTAGSLDKILSLHEARFISFLPLAHIAERMVSHYSQIHQGGETWFGGGIDTLRDDLATVRPTVFFAVPRVYEKFEAAIRKRLEDMGGAKGALVKLALDTGMRVATARAEGRRPAIADEALFEVLNRAILSQLRAQVGFDKLEALVSGAAPITIGTLIFFSALGLPIAEVYGQTEDCGPTSINPPDRIKIGTVGPPIPGCDVRIAEDGEILVRGGNVFAGYFKNPEASAECVDPDGWMHSGDLGEFDIDGYLKITGRKKDLIITAGGKNISPQNIESALKSDELVSQAVVIGDRRKFLSAIVTLDPEVVIDWAKAKGLPTDAEDLVAHADMIAYVQGVVDSVNGNLSSVEQIKKFTILANDFTQEAGEITPTLKVRRHKIEEKYGDTIEAMYT